uniref:Staphylococcal nuclease domain-containing protein 1 n=1 Tax=Lynceus sp. MCZ IZ 141354 TaxID=1930659 RepID=A0A9N6WVI3_9CRUS|nr:EOG090X01F7 [Lynceus sp. MCZ IZ 141354]
MAQPQPPAANPEKQPPQIFRGVVKSVSSGDAVVIRGQPKGGPPPEKSLFLSGITAPKLARRATNNAEETKDEPFAWDAREFLRKKVIGKEVVFVVDYKVPTTGREYGYLYLGKDPATGENLVESLINEGLVTVRQEGVRSSPELTKLVDLENAAKSAGKGKWASTPGLVRDIKWTVDNPRQFVDKFNGKPINAVVEHVRDGSTLRLFLLPDFQYITLMLSGIRCPGFKLDNEGKPDANQTEVFAEQARFYTESRLLHRDVEVILESVNNNNFVGSIVHPNGNIAELLLTEGFARCVDWSIAAVTGGPEKLRAAERQAKEKKYRIWKDYAPSGVQISGKDKQFTAKVVEIVNADGLMVKLNDGSFKKIFLASIRPPRLGEEKAEVQGKKGFRPIYDIPWMFEAREFLRKRLIGKKVDITVDYIQAASAQYPEKVCCSVCIGGLNVAEAMVAKGFATVLRYRQDDDQRSSHYDELLAAEMKATKNGKGIYDKKDIPTHRVADISGDLNKSKQFLPFLQRAGRMEAVVEFVASGSRLRLYIPRETCLITFLLGGITCPRAPRLNPVAEGEPFGEEALAFTKEHCLQHNVEIEIESMDKGGNFIGWLWVDGMNLSVGLVEDGLATVHFTAERSAYCKQLQIAEENAKRRRAKVWANYSEEKEAKPQPEEELSGKAERQVSYQNIVVTEVTEELHFYAQRVDQGAKLEQLMTQLRQELETNPPLSGAYTPKKGDICAARFTDGEWYRARVEKVTGTQVSVFYIDYGNRDVTQSAKCAALPAVYVSPHAFAQEFVPACVGLPKDADDIKEAVLAFTEDTLFKTLQMNVEYKANNVDAVTLVTPEENVDVVHELVADGILCVERRREKRLAELVSKYVTAQDLAKQRHLNIWRYGDITEDDANEFGVGKRG